jgi:sugar-specific transcriptional regulator TrmB
MVASLSVEEAIQTLKLLGLSEQQGRVLLALELSGCATAGTISKNSGVTREKVYTVLLSLEEKGLIRRAISTPVTFEATPLKDAISLLMRQKVAALDNLRTRTSKLIKYYQNNQQKTAIPKQDERLVLVSQKDAIIHCIENAVTATKTNMDAVINWNLFKKASLFSTTLKEAYHRGVENRLVVQIPKNHTQQRKLFEALAVPNLQARIISYPPPAVIGIYDNREILFGMLADADLKELTVVVSRNSCLVGLAKAYFSEMWANSEPMNTS